MIGMRLDVQKSFFDVGRIKKGLASGREKALNVFGGFTRKTARESIRKGKGPARPGQPPRNKTGTLKRFIYYAQDKIKDSVVIGPVRLRLKSRDVPAALEYGGTSTTTKGQVVAIHPHPFMQPAFDRATETLLPQIFANTLK